MKIIIPKYIRKEIIMEVELFDDIEKRKYIICGTDEAGRGPLAGPVVVSSVILPDDFPFSILNDSKKMTEKERQEAELIIKEKAICYSVTALSHRVIDKINILNASLEGMRKTSLSLYSSHPFDILLCDGNKIPSVPFFSRAIVKGDSLIPEIMAASILSKTERDRIMKLASTKWPEYGFDRHKGYPTKEHYLAIEKYGVCPIHRLSFKLFKNTNSIKEPTLF